MFNDGLFFLAILIFFFGVWLVGGGPNKPISFAGPYITPITNVGQTQGGYGDSLDSGWQGSLGSGWTGGISFGLGGRDEMLSDGTPETPEELRNRTLFGEASPFKGQVRIESAGGVSATDPDMEYLSIRASSSTGGPIDITGWSVASAASGRSARIGSGIEIPRVSDRGDILLYSGQNAYIVTGESPLGYSFHENMCTGYLSKSQRFAPSLEQRCPSASAEFDRYYSGNALKDDACYALMRNTATCTVPRDSRSLSSACQRLIDDHLTYTSCVETHRDDSGFSSGAWRIYLDRDQASGSKSTSTRGELWKSSREGIKLLDANGKTVDLYTY